MKSLADEYSDAKCDKQWELAHALDQLAEKWEPDTTGPWLVVRTAFHGGGQISRHQTARRAIERARRESASDCTCRCVGVVPEAQFDELPDKDTAKSPYVLAR